MTLARILSAAGTPKMEKATPAAMHAHPAVSIMLRHLEAAAVEETTRATTALTKRREGFHLGRADAYRHVISVLAQVKL